MKTPSSTAETALPVSAGSVVRRLAEGWSRFWFQPDDPATLGLIRLCVGLVTFYVVLVYTFDLQPLLGRDAWLDYETANKLRREAPVPIHSLDWNQPQPLPLPEDPVERQAVEDYMKEWDTDPRLMYTLGNPVWSVYYHVTDPGLMLLVHVCILTAVFLFAIGFCTRVTAVLTWIGVLSYIQRAPTTLFGMDTMMTIALVYLAVGPSGAAYSVDRLIARWWARRQGRELPVQPLVTANFAVRLMQVHFCFIYMAAGLSKLQGSMWWNGTAMWGVMANPSFNPVDVPLYHDALLFLCRHRWLWEVVTSGGTLFTLVLEIGLPFLIWIRPLRWIMICLAVALHVGIALTMGLVGFGLFMLCLLLAFVPSETTRSLVDGLIDSTRRQLGGLMGFQSAGKAAPSAAKAA